jgi:hypothetical protein
VAAVACSGRKAPPAQAAPASGSPQVPARPAQAEPKAPAVADPDADAEIIVGSQRGLEAWRRDGSGHRLVSKGSARHPRWLDDGAVLVLRPVNEDDLAKGARLEKITLADGKRARVAKVPPFAYGAPDAGAAAPDADVIPEIPFGLALQDPSDFTVDRSGHVACLVLMDRNINMADVVVGMRIDLATGDVLRHLEVGKETWEPPAGVALGDAERCTPKEAPAAPDPDPTSFRFAFDNEQVVERTPGAAAAPRLRLPGYSAEAGSPSGRWQVLGGDVEEGDYIHRSVVLLDRASGEVFPIRAAPGPWPAPLRPAGKKGPPRLRTPIGHTAEAVGETDLRWLGRSAASELLIVDALVVRPGGRAFSVKGEIAR